MQRSQSGNQSGNQGSGSKDESLDYLSNELASKTLVEVLDDMLEGHHNLRAAWVVLEGFQPTIPPQAGGFLVCERAAQILENLGEVRGAARVWEQVAVSWTRAGQPARALAAIVQMRRLDSPSQALTQKFVALYNIRSPHLDPSMRSPRIEAPEANVALEAIEARFAELREREQAQGGASRAEAQIAAQLLELVLSAPALSFEEPVAEASLPPLPLLSLLPQDALRRVLALMTLKKVARGEDIMEAGQPSGGLFWSVNQQLCVEREFIDPETGVRTERFQVPSGALLGLDALGSAAQSTRFTVTSCANSWVLSLSASAIERLQGEFGDFLNRLTTLRRHARSEGFLEHHGLFLQVERAQRVDLMRQFCGVRVSEGEVLVEQGGTSPGLFLVLDGQVEVVFRGQGQERSIETLGAGEVFGAVSVVSNRAAMACFRMATPGHVLFVSTEKFGQLAAQMPGIAKYAVKVANKRIQNIEEALEGGALAPLEGA